MNAAMACPQRSRGLSPSSHDGEGAEVADEAVLEDAMAKERIDADGIRLLTKADERLNAREI